MMVESIQARGIEGNYTVAAVLKQPGRSDREYEGEGRSVSEALFDLAEQVEQFELE
jgi:hypothetical protein